VGDDIAVIIEQRIIRRVEFADFIAFVKEIAGKAVVEILSWLQRLPAGNQNVSLRRILSSFRRTHSSGIRRLRYRMGSFISASSSFGTHQTASAGVCQRL